MKNKIKIKMESTSGTGYYKTPIKNTPRFHVGEELNPFSPAENSMRIKNSIMFFKSKHTGYVSHGPLLTSSDAESSAKYTEQSGPICEYAVVNLTNKDLGPVQGQPLSSLDRFNPF